MKRNIITTAAVSVIISSLITYSVCGGIGKNLIDAQSVYNADVNGDGKVNVIDLNVVKNIVLNSNSSDNNDNNGDNVTEDGQLTILCWNYNDSQPMVDLFCEKTGVDNSRINIKCFNVAGAAAANQYREYLSDSDNDADLIFLESSWCLDFINDDSQTIPLSELGYSESDFSDIYSYVVETGRSTTTGDLKGISWQSAAGAYCYRTDLAEQYLGVKSPDEMQEKINDWDKFMQTAQDLKTANGPAISATLGGVLNAYAFSKDSSWLDSDNKLTGEDFCTGYINYAKKLWDNGYVTHVQQWTDEWLPLGQTDDVMGFFVSSWGFGDTILTGAAGREDGATFGKWNCIPGPSDFYWGGTWLAPAARINNKELAKQFIDFFTINEDGAAAYAEKQGEYMSNKKVMESIIAKGDYTGAPVLGGQNQFEVLNRVANNIDVKGKITPYDALINNTLYSAADYYCNDTFFTVYDAYKDFIYSVNAYTGNDINWSSKFNFGPDWRSIYWTEIKKYSSNSSAMYELCDINGDYIPELFISTGQTQVDAVRIYTIKDNKLHFIDEKGSIGQLSINADKNVFCTSWIHSGVEIYDYFTISDNEIKILVSKMYDSIDNTYYVNDKKVTKTEYTNATKPEYKIAGSIGRKYKTTFNPSGL